MYTENFSLSILFEKICQIVSSRTVVEHFCHLHSSLKVSRTLYISVWKFEDVIYPSMSFQDAIHQSWGFQMQDTECKQHKNVHYETVERSNEITFSYENYSKLFIFFSKISNIGFKQTTDKSYIYSFFLVFWVVWLKLNF